MGRALLAIAAVLLLAGCSSPAPIPAPTQAVVSDPALASRFPASFTPDTAKAETIRLAMAIDTLFSTGVVHIDNNDQLVAATPTAGSYYGVLQNITLQQGIEPVTIAKAVAARLVASGWSQLQASDTSGVHLITLSSGSKASTSWFLIVSGDPRVTGAPVVQLQLASPDLP